jgi:hypothetical protein
MSGSSPARPPLSGLHRPLNKEKRSAIPARCMFLGCRRRLELVPVVELALSVGFGGVMRRYVCPEHPPIGACSQCGAMAGPQYMVKVLPRGLCSECLPNPHTH